MVGFWHTLSGAVTGDGGCGAPVRDDGARHRTASRSGCPTSREAPSGGVQRRARRAVGAAVLAGPSGEAYCLASAQPAGAKVSGMAKVRVNHDGWLALPAAVRRKLGLVTGD